MRIKDVAAAAGVSPATASRALNGASTVRTENRERVVRAARELGYRPNRLASNLRRQKVEVVGVVVSDIENPHFTEMVRAVEDRAYERGFRVLLCNTDEDPRRQRSYLDVLAAERCAGVVLAPSDPAGAEISALLDLGIAVVAFDRRVADGRADAVIGDNAGAARVATTHLLTAGHERIGLVGGPTTVETGAQRRHGYEAAMRAAGLTPRTADGGFRIEGGQTAAESLLGAVTALVVANNLMAIGVLRAVRARGLRVPDDLAIVAIDDPFWADLVQPPLTTLAQPVRAMAERAVGLLFEQLGEPRRAASVAAFDFELRVRESCGVAAP